MSVYLCGPIMNRSDSECIDWRLRAAELLAPILVLDPIRRDYRNHPEYNTPALAAQIVAHDTEDIFNSRALLVMFDKPSVGSMMEVRMAWAEVHIPVYVVDVSNTLRSPWLIYHTTEFFNNLEEACAKIRSIL